MQIKNLNSNYFYTNKEYLALIFLYLSLLVGFIFDENSTGGAITDYFVSKDIVKSFTLDFKDAFLNYERFSTRHSPVLLIFISILEKLNFTDSLIRIIHLHVCLLLPYLFFKIIKIQFNGVDNKIIILLISLIFLSPTFRTLSIWPDSRLLGLIFFTASIFYYIKFTIHKKFNYIILNIFLYALSAYLSPNFSVFSIFYLYKYILFFGIFSKKSISIYLINIILALPAIYYIFILEINFLNKSAAINIGENERVFFNNIFNDIIITFSIIFFYILPFLITKIIKLPKVFEPNKIILTLFISLVCIYFFDYEYLYSGGGIFFKFSNLLLNNNLIFYILSIISIILVLPYLIDNKINLLIFILIIINNPQYTIYHKYFDPFLLILFFFLFEFKILLRNIIINNFYIIYFYFSCFLVISNLKFLWKI